MEDGETITAGVIIVFALWLFLPRGFSEDKNELYSFEASRCNGYWVCDVSKVFPSISLRINTNESKIIWLDNGSGEIGNWVGCTIADKNNWNCQSPTTRMLNGVFQSENENVHFVSGYVWRIYWLLSFLPNSVKN